MPCDPYAYNESTIAKSSIQEISGRPIGLLCSPIKCMGTCTRKRSDHRNRWPVKSFKPQKTYTLPKITIPNVKCVCVCV